MAQAKPAGSDPHTQLLKTYHGVFTGADGGRVLRDLEAAFGGTAARPTAHETAVRAGEQNVLDYIKTRLQLAEQRRESLEVPA